MKSAARRDFLKTSAGLLGLALAGRYAAGTRRCPLLSFSTLGCPDWTFDEVLAFARQHGYDGIELRGILRQLDLPLCPEFSSAEKIRETTRRVQDHQLRIVDLGASTELHHTEASERQKNLDQARRFIDLAQKIDCPYVRVFPNALPEGDGRAAIIDLIIENLVTLGDYAKGSSVSVLMESHGDAVKTAELRHIMDSAHHPRVGLVWDIVNMWSVTRQPPREVYSQLKPYIRHTHVKDLTWVDGKEHYVLLGKGVAPIFEGLDALFQGGYTGYYSFEWEKLWHPDIDAPEAALADYPRAMRDHFKC